MNFTAILSFLLGSAQAAPFSLSTDRAIAVHLSPDGLQQIGQAVSQLIPNAVAITEGSNSFACSQDTNLSYALSDLNIFLQIDETQFSTASGALSLDLYGTLYSDQAQLDATGDCAIFTDLNESCSITLPTTAFSIAVDITISQINNQFVVNSSAVDFSLSPITNPVSGCLLEDALGTLLGQNSTAINDLITDAVEPGLVDLPQTIESSLEDALNSLNFATQTGLLNASLDIAVEPSMITVDESGLVLGLAAEVATDVPTSSCIDPSAFAAPEDSDWPTFSGTSLTSQLPYHVGIYLGSHFVDQILYATWASSALCLDAEALTGLALNGQLLASFFSEEVGTLMGDRPVSLAIEARQPPATVFDDDQPPVGIDIDRFALVLQGEVDDRKTRILQVDMETELGVQIELVDQDLVMKSDLSSQDFALTEAYSELISPGYSENVPALLDLAMGTFDLDLPSFGLPTFMGISMEHLVWEPDTEQSWQGGYIFINTDNVEALTIPACSASELACDGGGPSIEIDIVDQLGCAEASAGCDDSGCASSGKIRVPTGRIFGLMVILLGALLRRRQ